MPERPLAIAVASVNKDFRLPAEQRHTLKERVVSPRFDRSAKAFHALQDIGFEVERGEFFGIVGRNGSGKSTLLKCMAGIYRIDSGSIKIGGRLSTFIELGVGFNPDLAARDNIILNGIMLGLSPSEAASRVDEVIAFAELQDHVDLKLKNYSSGMQVRLAFSVMTQIDADVLLIDEVLAVGDASFQAKCFDVFRQLRERGKTIVLVTHDMATVARFCDRAMLIEDGKVVDIGDPERIGDRYLALNFSDHGLTGNGEASVAGVNGDASGHDEFVSRDAPVSIVGATVLDLENERVQSVRTGDIVAIAVDVRVQRTLESPSMTFELRDETNAIVFSTTTQQAVRAGGSTPSTGAQLVAGTTWRMCVWVRVLLRPGQVRVRAIVRDSLEGEVFERSGDLARVEVTSVEPVLGTANLPHHVVWDSTDAQFDTPDTLVPVGGLVEAVRR